jgi:hypothetical protein
MKALRFDLPALLCGAIILAGCQSPNIAGQEPLDRFGAYLRSPQGGEQYAVGDTVRLELVADASELIIAIWLVIHDNQNLRLMVHVNEYRSLDMAAADQFRILASPDTINGRIRMTLGWIVPDTLRTHPEACALRGRKIDIECHPFQYVDYNDVFSIAEPIRIAP